MIMHLHQFYFQLLGHSRFFGNLLGLFFSFLLGCCCCCFFQFSLRLGCSCFLFSLLLGILDCLLGLVNLRVGCTVCSGGSSGVFIGTRDLGLC